jgi:hypothetical protein
MAITASADVPIGDRPCALGRCSLGNKGAALAHERRNATDGSKRCQRARFGQG